VPKTYATKAVFMNHAACAVTPLDPELIQVCDAVG
jgi:hypothetical protein